MLILQIILFVTFVFLILGYSYMLITPALLIGYTPIITYVKTLAQSFVTQVMISGFKTNFKLAKSDQDIIKLMNENTELIDIIICNHTSTIDFLVIMSYLQHFNIDSYNFVLKNQIIYTPGFGLIMYASPDIKLNRNWDQDKDTMGKQLDKIKLNGSKQVILIFPEGTRLSETKLKEGQDFSIKKNLPVFSNLLVPKSKGLWFIVKHLKDSNKLGRIWDVTLTIPKFIGKTAYSSKIFGKPLGDIYTVWREVTICTDYKDMDKFKKWLIDLWLTKDSFINNYKNLIYEDIQPNNNIKIGANISIIIILIASFWLIINNYGRYYLLFSFLLTYGLIFFKL